MLHVIIGRGTANQKDMDLLADLSSDYPAQVIGAKALAEGNFSALDLDEQSNGMRPFANLFKTLFAIALEARFQIKKLIRHSDKNHFDLSKKFVKQYAEALIDADIPKKWV